MMKRIGGRRRLSRKREVIRSPSSNKRSRSQVVTGRNEARRRTWADKSIDCRPTRAKVCESRRDARSVTARCIGAINRCASCVLAGRSLISVGRSGWG